MPFCHLSGGQTAALMFIVGAMSAPNTPDALKKLIQDKDWHTLQVILAMGTGKGVTVPSEDDIRAVGDMSPGLQNAYFLLALIDAKATDAAKAQFQNALNTHCWDAVANAVMDNMKETGLVLTGEDLHQAYAPYDMLPCDPGNLMIAVVLGQLIKTGELVGDFFSKTLGDFFQHDFANFFTDTIPDFFKGPFSEFFDDLGNHIKDGFEEFGKSVQKVFEDLGRKLDPTSW
jgi:hypothetical protein